MFILKLVERNVHQQRAYYDRMKFNVGRQNQRVTCDFPSSLDLWLNGCIEYFMALRSWIQHRARARARVRWCWKNVHEFIWLADGRAYALATRTTDASTKNSISFGSKMNRSDTIIAVIIIFRHHEHRRQQQQQYNSIEFSRLTKKSTLRLIACSLA